MQTSPYQEGSHSFLAQCGEISHAFSYPFSRLSLEKPCTLGSVIGFMTEGMGPKLATHKELFDRV